MSAAALPYDELLVAAVLRESLLDMPSRLAPAGIRRWLDFVEDKEPDEADLTTAQALDVIEELGRLLNHDAFGRAEVQRIVLARLVSAYVLRRSRLCVSGLIGRVRDKALQNEKADLGNVAQHVKNIRKHLAICNWEPGGRARIVFPQNSPKGQTYVPRIVFADREGKFNLRVGGPERHIQLRYKSDELACLIAERLLEHSEDVLIAGRTGQPLLFEACLTQAVVDPRRRGALSIRLLARKNAPRDKRLARGWRLVAEWSKSPAVGALTRAAHGDPSLTWTIVEIGPHIYVSTTDGPTDDSREAIFTELKPDDPLYRDVRAKIPQVASSNP